MKNYTPSMIRTNALRSARVCKKFSELPEKIEAEISKITTSYRLRWIPGGPVGFGVYIHRKAKPLVYLYASVSEFDPELIVKPVQIKIEVYSGNLRDLPFIESGSPQELPKLLRRNLKF